MTADDSMVSPEPGDAPSQANPPQAATTATRRRVWPALLSPVLALVLALVVQAAIGAVVVAGLIGEGVSIDALGERVQQAMLTPGWFLVLLVVGPGAFGVVALLAARLSPETTKKRLQFFAIRDPARVYGLTMLGSIAPLALAIWLARAVAWMTDASGELDQLFEQFTPLTGALFVVLIALVPGFCEEMLFRGYIQQRLIQRWGPAWGIGVASVLFALAHVMPPNIAVALPLGVWLGVIAWRTGSIGPSIACHAFVNGGVNLWRLVSQSLNLSEAAHHTVDAILVAIGLVAFAFACRMLAAYPQPAR